MANESAILPERFQPLSDLARNLWFSWNSDAIRLFRSIDPERWERTGHNPVRMLAETPDDVWTALAGDEAFIALYDRVAGRYAQYRGRESRFARRYPDHHNDVIAYFSAEFGFHESLPIYSGGLGVLAGDHCKSASDLGLPFVGVGLLYKMGYFRQRIDGSGSQQAERVAHEFSLLPISPAQVDGQEVIVDVRIGASNVKLKVWKADIGNIPLYLLDSDLPDNAPQDRELTSQLYGGNQEMRISQEIALGVGGVKALRALKLAPRVYHINEGHAAFLSIERIREYVHAAIPFETALELVRGSTVFTTHTPVPAGHDAFPMDMLERYLEPLLSQLVYERERVVKLGYDPEKNLFNMTYLALNTASYRNGVSKLHGQVSRVMFRNFHGNMPVDDVPIGHVINGVHMETWLASEIGELLDEYFPADWRQNQSDPEMWNALNGVPDEKLWETHGALKRKLIDYARRNVAEQLKRSGEAADRIAEADSFLSPDVLTIGFARRFATYKRANLLFKDLDRLNRIVNHPERPVQFLFAGKAHPADFPGQDLIREIYRVSRLDAFRGKIVLLENYDMDMARHLVQGVDIWLNNPLRPLEASGTSGEKAAMNGAINFSVLDGWWEEGYDRTNGWAIESNPDSDWQAQEQENAESLYRNLEQEIVPLYYGDDGDVPHGWVARMKRSIVTLAPEYNTQRMVQEYASRFYVRTMKRFAELEANDSAGAADLAKYKLMIRDHWHYVNVRSVFDDTGFKAPPGMKEVKADIQLGPIASDGVVVEIIYYEERGGVWKPVHVRMEPETKLGEGTIRFRARVPEHLAHVQHYTVRVLPYHPLFAHKFELPQWTTTVY